LQEPHRNIEEEAYWWQAIQSGDKKAFSLFYDFHIQGLYRYAQRVTRDDIIIADAIQDIFFEVWKNREKLSPPKSFRFYLLAMLRNRIIYLSKDTHYIPLERVAETSEMSESPEENFIEHEFIATKNKQVHHFLKMLSDNQQQILILRFFEELSYSEIADLLQIKEQSVRNLIQRSILKLRDLMDIQH
jgi:RNA polymerase sigma-70 factor (ECF subfamily)